MPKNIKNSNLALIGLIILFAFSLIMAGGRKPPEMYSQLGLTPLSPEEKQIIDNAYLQSGDRGEIAKYQRYWYKFEVHTLLKKVFPAVQFYKLNSGITVPETPYITGYRNGKFYNLPSGFNRLLLDNNLEVNDKNIIELAKAFVVIALMDNPSIDYSQPNWEDNLDKLPEITFLEGKRIKKRVGSAGIYNAFVKVKIGDEIQEWYFRTGYGGQFWEVAVGYPATKEFYHKYHPLPAEKKIEEGGWDNSPQIKIELGYGGVYLELENNIYHYYLME